MSKQLAADPQLYERDFYTWSLRQADLVRARRFADLDLDNVPEELESLGREQAHKLRSSLRVLALHLLKWRFRPLRCSRSWRATIVRERTNVEDLLDDNPGLRPRAAALFASAYRGARMEAAAETGLPLATFPETAPFSLAQAIDDGFWPEAG
jgi:hypothetical protein